MTCRGADGITRWAAHRGKAVRGQLDAAALYVSGRDRRGGGVVVEIENDILKHVKNEAVWPYVPYVFIGENAKGDHVRVVYFPGAVAPAPS